MYQVKTRILFVEGGFTREEIKKIFQYTREYLRKADVELVPEKFKKVYDYSLMMPRSIPQSEWTKWVFNFGKDNKHGWWVEQEGLLQILLVPAFFKYPTIDVSEEKDPSRLWCLVSSSSLLPLQSSKRSTAVCISHGIGRLLGAQYDHRQFPNIMVPFVNAWFDHSKDISFSKGSIKEIRSWFAGKGFEKVKREKK